MSNREISLNWKLLPAVFIDRPNRFLVRVNLQKEIVECHLPDPGRLEELLQPGAKVLVKRENGPQRKTKYSTQMVYLGEQLISVNTLLPNFCVNKLLKTNSIKQFSDWELIQREKLFGKSRFDFFLKKGEARLVLEVKSVTLVKNRIAMFPDAVTSRGTKHLKHLTDLTGKGYKTAVLFVVQRDDADFCMANTECDPKFAENLRTAWDSGVAVHSIKFKVFPNKIIFSGNLPFKFDKIG